MEKIAVSRDPRRARAVGPVFYQEMLRGEEGLHWLNSEKLGALLPRPALCVNTAWGPAEELIEDRRPRWLWGGGGSAPEVAEGLNAEVQQAPEVADEGQPAEGKADGKARVNLLALGDVGGTVLIGLKLLGGDVISEIGICDINLQMCQRWEYEMNQTVYPWDYEALPAVKIVEQKDLFDCDVFVFCASKAVPPVGREDVDVRMVQFDANRKIVGSYARMAREAGFRGLFAVVSDPVEPLCREVFLESNRPKARDASGADGGMGSGMGVAGGNPGPRGSSPGWWGEDFDGLGLWPEQIQGYGLGVMNGRAAYYAKKYPRFASFLTEGRAFGPHGKDLVIANSIENYDDELSRELTKLAAEANLRTRETGFKPYIAPALSSAAISILLTLRKQWHYSSVFLGGVYMGCRNRFGPEGLETEALALPEQLYGRLRFAWERLDAVR